MLFLRKFPKIAFSPFPPKLSPFKIIFTFCSNTSNQPSITSPETLSKFSSLVQNSSEEALTDAAQMMASLEVELETLEQQIKEMQLRLEECPSHIKLLIQKIQKVIDNIELQKEQIIGIEMRAEKELKDCRNYSVGNVAKQVLETADNLHKCYKHAMEINGNDEAKEEVKIIRCLKNQLDGIFQIYGIKEFDPVGELFDPNMQQAIAHVPLIEGQTSNTVAFTMRTGYTIKGRLLRSAHVGVYQ